MISTKERAKLKGLAQKIEPVFQIGKNGVTDNVIEHISVALDARELIKINVLKNSDENAKTVVNTLAEKLNAEAVAAIGNKIVLYRYSDKKGVVHVL
ncbi:MAG: ribosome assembly RNA-binding protein YhbY [Christensenellaceae bacterium]|nr:ribosome assembly RNA-binding protein YhbY [Christensenellaceae bacterium]